MSTYSDSDSGAAGWLVGAVKNNPEGLLLLAAGCALLMRSTGASKSRRSRDVRVYDRNDMTQRAREARDRTVGERLSETAQSAGEYVSDISESIVETASGYASSVSRLCRRCRASDCGAFRPIGAAGAVQRTGHDQPRGAGAAIDSGPSWRGRGGGSRGCLSSHRS